VGVLGVGGCIGLGVGGGLVPWACGWEFGGHQPARGRQPRLAGLAGGGWLLGASSAEPGRASLRCELGVNALEKVGLGFGLCEL